MLFRRKENVSVHTIAVWGTFQRREASARHCRFDYSIQRTNTGRSGLTPIYIMIRYSVIRYIKGVLMGRRRKNASGSPLEWTELRVMTAIAGGELHGYAIMQKVAEQSNEAVQMGPGTLYGTVKRLFAAGLIEESRSRRKSNDDDSRRKYYRLTRTGKALLTQEIAHLENLVSCCKSSLALQ